MKKIIFFSVVVHAVSISTAYAMYTKMAMGVSACLFGRAAYVCHEYMQNQGTIAYYDAAYIKSSKVNPGPQSIALQLFDDLVRDGCACVVRASKN